MCLCSRHDRRCQSDILVSGMLAGAHQSEFLWTTLMELATLGCAFLALRLFKFDRVHRALNEQKAVALKKWGLLRLLLLFLPLLADTLLYYIYMNPTFGYLGIILALCLPFVYPSEGRCISETE